MKEDWLPSARHEHSMSVGLTKRLRFAHVMPLVDYSGNQWMRRALSA